MTKKYLNDIDLKGKLLINGSGGTNGYFLQTNGSGVISWAAASGGGSGFTGAGTSITGILGTAVSGTSTATSGSITFSTGTASASANFGTATSGDLTIKTGDVTATDTVNGAAVPGNISIDNGTPNSIDIRGVSYIYVGRNNAYSTYIEAGGFPAGSTNGVFIGSSGTPKVEIGASDAITGAYVVNIMARSGSNTKTLKLATDGGTTSIKIGTGATTPTIELGNNATASTTTIKGKVFVWQPVTGTTSPLAPTAIATTGATTLTAAQLLTFIIQYTGATAATFTIPTGTLMDSNVQNSFTAMGFDWSIIATAAGAVTVSGGTGHTYVGGTTVSAGTSARFRSTRSTTNVWITFRIS
jgi:hypothetical protein